MIIGDEYIIDYSNDCDKRLDGVIWKTPYYLSDNVGMWNLLNDDRTIMADELCL